MAPQPPGSGNGVKISDIPVQLSELTTLKKSIVWKVKGITNIRHANAWEAVTCKLEVGDTIWELHLFSDGKYLYVRPTIIQPLNKPLVYSLKTSVVNNNNVVVYTPGLVNKAAVTSGINKESHKWEIMKFGDATMELFSNYIFEDSLKVLVEMTLHVQM